jgi:peroxiredoxin (alkyl hydroperoxide reductase subunit C)
MVLIGKKFPQIVVKGINNLGREIRFNLVHEIIQSNKNAIIFWYPKDFTNICPSELHALQDKIDEFNKRNCLIFAASCDTCETHLAWLNTPKEVGGIKGITFPILSDTKRELSSLLGILDSDDNVSYRATYLLDNNGIVYYESVNDMKIARNIEDYLRLIDAKKFIEEKGTACPANWKVGDEGVEYSVYDMKFSFL